VAGVFIRRERTHGWRLRAIDFRKWIEAHIRLDVGTGPKGAHRLSLLAWDTRTLDPDWTLPVAVRKELAAPSAGPASSSQR
jgi:hypothetical protein